MTLRAEGISRTFFRNAKSTNFFYAVLKTDFTLKKGAITAIVGRSGSGKTTFLNMLAGLLTPTEGKVYLGDKDLFSMEDEERSALRNKTIGVVPQGQTGLQSLTVSENVLVPAALYGNAEKKEERALELLQKLGIAELKDCYPNELSGGELRRMAIARAFINDPEVIFADEPTGDLDDESTESVMNLFKEFVKTGKSVLIITHDKSAALYADEIYEMNGGALVKTKNQ